MRRFLLFLIVPLFFFLSINIHPASAITCVEGLIPNPLNPVYFEVKNDCGLWNWDKDCAANEKCDYFRGWCAASGGPCIPLDCTGCQVAENHKCVSQPRPASTPNCCSKPCIEGGSGYSASLFDQQCYSLTNIQTDANNCGNKCVGGDQRL